MAEEKKNAAVEEEQELDLESLEQVSGGSMKNVYIKKTSDLTENMIKNA